MRTVYRDVDALAQAGVPVYAEPGRTGGIRLREGYRVGGLPRLDDAEARGALLAAAPSVAEELGLGTATATPKLLAAMEPRAEEAAQSLRQRLLIEPDAWFKEREPVPFLVDVAHGVWEARELMLSYERATGAGSETVRPLALVLKGDAWYLLARSRRNGDRLFRISRITDATVLDRTFERPADFDLAQAWEARKRTFVASIPRYFASVRVAPAGEPRLHLLREGTPPLPLGPDVARDEGGWALLRLRFERVESAAELLLQLGADLEVTGPPELRGRMASTARRLHELYAGAA